MSFRGSIYYTVKRGINRGGWGYPPGKLRKSLVSYLKTMYTNISEAVQAYSPGRTRFTKVLEELLELGEGVIRLDVKNIREEIGDVAHFMQLWLYWNFGLNGAPWRVSHESIRKFMARIPIWAELYRVSGLPATTPSWAGNYKKCHKVVAHLGRYGVSAEEAEHAYQTVIINQNERKYAVR